MTRAQVYEKLNEVFRDVFDEPSISLNDTTTAADITGWDSLIHITLLNSVEDELGVQFDMDEVVSMQNVGQMADSILAHMG